MKRNKPSPEVNDDLISRLVDDQTLADRSNGAYKKTSIQQARSIGAWPLTTYHIGRVPHTDWNEFVEHIKSNRIPGRGKEVA